MSLQDKEDSTIRMNWCTKALALCAALFYSERKSQDKFVQHVMIGLLSIAMATRNRRQRRAVPAQR